MYSIECLTYSVQEKAIKDVQTLPRETTGRVSSRKNVGGEVVASAVQNVLNVLRLINSPEEVWPTALFQLVHIKHGSSFSGGLSSYG